MKLIFSKLTLKQQEQLSRPRPFLFLLILCAFGLPWLLLLRNGIYSRQQQARMTLQENDFFTQFETYPRNDSAKRFDQLGADLGFVPSDPRHLIFEVDPDAEKAYYTIEKSLNAFLQRQTAKSAGSLDPIPSELTTYLSTAKPALQALQAHILKSEEPKWEIDIERMSEQNYPVSGLVNAVNTQKLLMLSAIDYHQRRQRSEMLAALEASWQLNQAIAKRPDLISQISTSVVSEYQAGVLRHTPEISSLPTISSQWQARLAQQAQQQSVIKGMEFDVWLQYKSIQKALSQIVTRSTGFSYWFSPIYSFNLNHIDTAQAAHEAIDQLRHLSVCSTTQASVEQMLAQKEVSRSNEAIAPAPNVLAQRWKLTGDRALALELTQKILLVKQQAQASQHWPTSLSNTTSTTCPEAHWVYQQKAGHMTLSLSTALVPAPVVPLSYQFPLQPASK